MNISCLFGIHDWKYEATVIRSCGSELEKHYRCTRCGERKYFKFPRCIYVTDDNPECYRMRK